MNMDRKTLIGMLLLAALFMGWYYYMTSGKEEQAAVEKRKQDSIARIEQAARAKEDSIAKIKADSAARELAKRDTGVNRLNKDSLRHVERLKQYGPFVTGMNSVKGNIVMENELIRAEISPLGGRIATVTLKGHKTYSGDPLVLFTADSSTYALQLSTAATSQNFRTDTLYFTPVGKSFSVSGRDSGSVRMRLYASADSSKYIEYAYGLRGDSYMPSFHVNFVNMNGVIRDQVDLVWAMVTPKQEKNVKNERMIATVHYLFDTKEEDYISEAAEEEVALTGDVKWISFKQQFFSSVLIANDKFPNGTSVSSYNAVDPRFVKRFNASVPIPFGRGANESVKMKFYFGPNKYSILKSYDGLELQSQIKLGIFGFLNRWVFIPLFDFFSANIVSMGLVIFLLTLVVKLVLFPLAYKSFLSSAKMRVLKPEMEELSEKFKDGDPMQKQQATMALYRKAGVNPMAGCVPLLLQIPILFALISFFPAAFELRQKGFLWAEDLSTYDSILNLGFEIPFYGSHVSLFALLMTVSTVIYTWMNQQMMPTNNQFPAMKWMMYLMPVFFLGFLNSYAAALSYYYFVSNLITFAQMWFMRRFMIDEKKLRAQIEENKKKPAKKSGFMQRLEQAQKARMEQLRQQQDQKGKKKKK